MKGLQRMVPLSMGKRTGIRLDSATWSAIDWLSRDRDGGWKAWCAQIIEETPKTENFAAAIRAAVIEGLMLSSIVPSRGEDLILMEQHPLLKVNASLNDRELAADLACAEVQGWSDFIAFRIGFGWDSAGRARLWVQNSMRDGLHFTIAVSEESFR